MFKSLWRVPRIVQHPHWYIHQYVADIVVYGFRQQIKAMCSAAAVVAAPAWPDTGLHSAAQLKKMPACLASITMYSAYELVDPAAAVGVPGDQSKWQSLAGVHGDGWQLFEDRQEKPGWITETKGSKLVLPLTFGPEPRVALTYLRGYEGIGS